MLKLMGINNLITFEFMDTPPHEMLVQGLEQLYDLGAFNGKGELKRFGRNKTEFPVDPMLAKNIILSEEY